jgi:hypothetical protein
VPDTAIIDAFFLLNTLKTHLQEALKGADIRIFRYPRYLAAFDALSVSTG